jgi:integrase/recombinase XerD
MTDENDFIYWNKKFKDVELFVLPDNYKLMKEHLRDVKERCTIRTVINQTQLLTQFIKWCQQKPFTELTKSDIGDFCDSLEGKAESTISSTKTAIKTFLKNINPTVAATIKPKQMRSTKTPDSLLTEADIDALIKAAPNNRDRALIACLYDSGARKGELLSTTIADAKFDSYGCILWLREGKTGNRPARLVFASSYLKEWLEVHPTKEKLNSPIFCSMREPYNLISRSGLYQQIELIAKKAGVTKDVNCHNFRHTRATDLAKKITEQEMKAVLGWVPGSEMSSIYIHLSAQDVNKAMLKASGIEISEEDKQPSLFSSERCPRCKELNDKTREICFKCGLPLSEKTRKEEEEAKKKAEDERLAKIKGELKEELSVVSISNYRELQKQMQEMEAKFREIYRLPFETNIELTEQERRDLELKYSKIKKKE